jgi:hypothetical protein
MYKKILQIACVFPISMGYGEREGEEKEREKIAKMQDGKIAVICDGTYPCRLSFRVVLKTSG